MKENLKMHIGLALLRIAPSAMLLTHGIPKLQQFFSGEEIKFADPIGLGASPSMFLAIIGEFLCPIFIILGFKTRWFAVPSAITMAVAALIHHSADPFGVKEKAFLYMICFIVIILLGPGKYSLDKK